MLDSFDLIVLWLSSARRSQDFPRGQLTTPKTKVIDALDESTWTLDEITRPPGWTGWTAGPLNSHRFVLAPNQEGRERRENAKELARLVRVHVYAGCVCVREWSAVEKTAA